MSNCTVFVASPFVTRFDEVRLAFDNSKEIFSFVQQGSQLGLFVRCPAFAQAHRQIPAQTRRFKLLCRPVVAALADTTVSSSCSKP